MGRYKMNTRHFYRPDETLESDHLHYKECGLDNVFLLNGFTLETIDGEEFLTVSDVDGLHKAIGLHIVLSRKAPSGKEMRFLRNELDMSQSDLARVLSVSDQSVARWEKSQTDAPGPAVLALRVIYLLSLAPEKEREEILSGLLQRLKDLSDADETSDSATFTYQNDQWFDQAA
jgi:DNA-binding transcriptional regulator YiaG